MREVLLERNRKRSKPVVACIELEFHDQCDDDELLYPVNVSTLLNHVKSCVVLGLFFVVLVLVFFFFFDLVQV